MEILRGCSSEHAEDSKISPFNVALTIASPIVVHTRPDYATYPKTFDQFHADLIYTLCTEVECSCEAVLGS
jgi:hypothetical protein